MTGSRTASLPRRVLTTVAGQAPRIVDMPEADIASVALSDRCDVVLGEGGVLTRLTAAGRPTARWRVVAS